MIKSDFTNALINDKVIHKNGYIGYVDYLRVTGYNKDEQYVFVDFPGRKLNEDEFIYRLDGTDASTGSTVMIWLYDDLKPLEDAAE